MKPETCPVLSSMGDTLQIHYTVRQHIRVRQKPLHCVCILQRVVGKPAQLMTNAHIVYVAPCAWNMWTRLLHTDTHVSNEQLCGQQAFRLSIGADSGWVCVRVHSRISEAEAGLVQHVSSNSPVCQWDRLPAFWYVGIKELDIFDAELSLIWGSLVMPWTSFENNYYSLFLNPQTILSLFQLSEWEYLLSPVQ